MAENKSEKPTKRRLDKARGDGKFPSSKDFVSGLQFLVFLALLSSFGPAWVASIKQSAVTAFSVAFVPDLTNPQLVRVFTDLLRKTLFPIALTGSALVVSGLVFQLASTGGGLSLNRLAPSAKNFDPIAKFKNIPTQGVPAVLQAILLLGVFGTGIYWMVTTRAVSMMLAPLGNLQTGIDRMQEVLVDVLWKGAEVFLLVGVFDYFRQIRRFTKEMKMSKQEVRDEAKETDGNPQTKMRVRRLQRDLRRRKMMSEVATATAVIVNPTHYAVAIRYQHDKMSTPQVVAKGKNYLAARIRKRATDNNVPLIENPPLAQALYKSVEVGQEIPPELYRAVAEILAYVYKLMGTKLG